MNIYVLLFKEVEVALPLKSAYSKIVLQHRSEQIKVMRHPRTLISMWSHHEKMLIVDQELAFVGGLDLCFGRMDTREHRLEDMPDNREEVRFPGQDYSNVRIADFHDVDKKERCLIDRKSQPRMPWHDVAASFRGPVVKDLIVHFIHYWNHAKVDITGPADKEGLLNPRFSVYADSVPPQKSKLEGMSTLELSQEMGDALDSSVQLAESKPEPKLRLTLHSRMPQPSVSVILPECAELL